MPTSDWVNWFRHSSPYINTHRHRTVVLSIDGEAVLHENFTNIVHDIALLSSLGVRLVVAFGARPQIEARLQASGIQSAFHGVQRITTEVMLDKVVDAVGMVRAAWEARLSMGIANSPMHNARLKVCGGNLVMAKPVGVVDGIDLENTGKIRKVDGKAIKKLLDAGFVVLLPPLAYSITGEVFNINYESVGAAAAAALQADKLVMFSDKEGVLDEQGRVISELSLGQALERLKQDVHLSVHSLSLIQAACDACEQGVTRAHVINYQQNGALLTELFTRDGSGTLISGDIYEQVREAQTKDIPGIEKLIRPLEKQAVLVARTRENLETELKNFIIDERDGAVIGCAALNSYDKQAGELYCFAVREDYRRTGRGDRLLEEIEKKASRSGIKTLFVLTTQTHHWFIERGYTETKPENLPEAKKINYSLDRNSKVLIKQFLG